MWKPNAVSFQGEVNSSQGEGWLYLVMSAPVYTKDSAYVPRCQLWNKWHPNWIFQSGGVKCGICTQRLSDRLRERRGSQPLTELQKKDSKWQVRLIDWQGLTEDRVVIHRVKERKAAFLFFRSELSVEGWWRWKYEYWIIQPTSFLESKKGLRVVHGVKG